MARGYSEAELDDMAEMAYERSKKLPPDPYEVEYEEENARREQAEWDKWVLKHPEVLEPSPVCTITEEIGVPSDTPETNKDAELQWRRQFYLNKDSSFADKLAEALSDEWEYYHTHKRPEGKCPEYVTRRLRELMMTNCPARELFEQYMHDINILQDMGISNDGETKFWYVSGQFEARKYWTEQIEPAIKKVPDILNKYKPENESVSDKTVITLKQDAYLESDGVTEWYEAYGEDAAGNGYMVSWFISKPELHALGDEDCCDWDNPDEIIKLSTCKSIDVSTVEVQPYQAPTKSRDLHHDR